MSFNKPIRRVAIVGTGVIGASWAAEYLARGFDVVANDPAPNAEANLRKYVDDAWEQLKAIGLSAGASRGRLTFNSNMKEALSNADFVQENGPERRDVVNLDEACICCQILPWEERCRKGDCHDEKSIGLRDVSRSGRFTANGGRRIDIQGRDRRHSRLVRCGGSPDTADGAGRRERKSEYRS